MCSRDAGAAEPAPTPSSKLQCLAQRVHPFGRMAENETRVESWDELVNLLYQGSWHEEIGRYRANNIFRGLNSVHYDLTTSLARLGGSRKLEDHMLRAFRRYAHRPELAETTIWNWLALAQHHGLSTRLLDWTYSPFVAMHFATANLDRFDLDGVIWAVNHRKTNVLLPQRLKDVLAEEGTDVFTAEMLDRVAGDLQEYERLSDEPFVAFFEPPSIDERIVNQYALFSLMSDPEVHLDRWLCEHPDVYRRIIIPAELKMEVRDKLDTANVTERVLYPGLDGLTRWLNRYYMPARDGDEDACDEPA